LMSNVTTGRRDVEVSTKHVSYKPYINAHMIVRISHATSRHAQ
jgi:hypothetical protein